MTTNSAIKYLIYMSQEIFMTIMCSQDAKTNKWVHWKLVRHNSEWDQLLLIDHWMLFLPSQQFSATWTVKVPPLLTLLGYTVASYHTTYCSVPLREECRWRHIKLQMNLPVWTKGTQILHACLRNNSTVRLEFKMGLFKFVRYTNALDTGEVENTIVPIYKMSPF